MLFSDGPKVKIKLFHHGEIIVGINVRLGDPEMNSVLTLTQEHDDEKDRRDREKQKQQEEKEVQKKGKKTDGKKAEEEKKSK